MDNNIIKQLNDIFCEAFRRAWQKALNNEPGYSHIPEAFESQGHHLVMSPHGNTEIYPIYDYDCVGMTGQYSFEHYGDNRLSASEHDDMENEDDQPLLIPKFEINGNNDNITAADIPALRDVMNDIAPELLPDLEKILQNIKAKQKMPAAQKNIQPQTPVAPKEQPPLKRFIGAIKNLRDKLPPTQAK
ncbi:MAG: hypothetical protein LBH47_02365 [Christensenellaceae bacterium]|jgi:hypothetical protein|nr:hypothetical protein [Christensenellaceae bacterium]